MKDSAISDRIYLIEKYDSASQCKYILIISLEGTTIK